MATLVCPNCEERVPEDLTFVAMRFGGGAYNRAGRYYKTRVCADCAAWLIATATPGYSDNNRWGLSSLAWGLRGLRRAVPEKGSEYNNGRYGGRPDHFSKEV